MSKIFISIFLAIGILTGAFLLLSRTPSSPQVLSSDSLPAALSPLPTGNIQPTETPLIDPNHIYSALLKTTAGDMTIDLTATATPKTVDNFVKLSRQGFYNNTIFHRIISGFMIQGGDPKGDGTGGPGYTFADEPFSGEYTRGTVAMANSGPNTNGSQFFIMHKDYALPHNYVIFGHLTAGFETLDKIATASTSANVNMPGENSVPVSPVKILYVSIIEK